MTMSDRLLGLLGGGLVLTAIVLLFAGGEADTGAASPISPPEVELLAPADGEVLDGPLEVVFRATEQLALKPGGWGVGDYHIHLSLDGVELMPGGSDIVRGADGEYRWRVGDLRPGEHEIRLLWSGLDHRPIPGTETQAVRVTAE